MTGDADSVLGGLKRLGDWVEEHHRRMLDRPGVALLILGLVAHVVAAVLGTLGHLQADDLVNAGSVLGAAGGLFLSFGASKIQNHSRRFEAADIKRGG